MALQPQPPQRPPMPPPKTPPPAPPPNSSPKKDAKDSVTPFTLTGSASPLTVTSVNPTPPTNIPCVSYGTPPVVGVTFAFPAAPVRTGDATLFAGAPAPGTWTATTAIAAPVGGSGGTGAVGGNVAQTTATIAATQVVPEATGTVVVDAKAGQSSVTVQGAWSATPNANHPSGQAPATLPTITSLVPASTAASGGTMNLTVNGTGFEELSQVYVGGIPNATNYISATQLQAINAPKRTTAGTTPITVVTGGTASAATNWTFV